MEVVVAKSPKGSKPKKPNQKVAPIRRRKRTESTSPDSDVPGNDLDVLARTIFGEARGELLGGKIAVAHVVLNRVAAKRWFGRTIKEVCLKPYQFSCWNENDPNRNLLLRVEYRDPTFRSCWEVAAAVIDGRYPDVTLGSCHYHTTSVRPDWAEDKLPVIQVGGHLFFQNID